MNDGKWEEIIEEHRVINEAMREYLQTLNAAQELVESSTDLMDRSRMLLSKYHRMRELAHIAEVQIAKAGEALTIDMTRNNRNH